MDRYTGRTISEPEHIRQSIADILTTPIGSRVMRREYGSLLPELIDAPTNPGLQLQLMAATVTALLRWEPRIIIDAVEINVMPPASVALTLHTRDAADRTSEMGLILNMRHA